MDEDKEKLKEDMALEIASGSSNVLQCQDVFEGNTPQVRDALAPHLSARLLLSYVCALGKRLHSIQLFAMEPCAPAQQPGPTAIRGLGEDALHCAVWRVAVLLATEQEVEAACAGDCSVRGRGAAAGAGGEEQGGGRV